MRKGREPRAGYKSCAPPMGADPSTVPTLRQKAVSTGLRPKNRARLETRFKHWWWAMVNGCTTYFWPAIADLSEIGVPKGECEWSRCPRLPGRRCFKANSLSKKIHLSHHSHHRTHHIYTSRLVLHGCCGERTPEGCERHNRSGVGRMVGALLCGW